MNWQSFLKCPLVDAVWSILFLQNKHWEAQFAPPYFLIPQVLEIQKSANECIQVFSIWWSSAVKYDHRLESTTSVDKSYGEEGVKFSDE